MSLNFVAFTDAFTGTAIDINPADVNIDACQQLPTSQLPQGVANATRIWVRGVVHNVVGTLAVTIAALIAGSAGNAGAPSNAIYVDLAGNDATGMRGNPGLPFLTMSAAVGVAQSGDEILVSPGSYTGTLNHFQLPAIANLVIRGSGEFAGDTVVSGAAGEDVCTLAAANRSILFDNIQIAGLTTGRGIVGTGATAAGAWLSSGFGLALQDCVVSSAASDAIALTDANSALFRDTVLVGNATYTTNSSVIYQDTLQTGNVTWTWDNTDANKPTAGQGAGFQLYAGSAISGTTTLGGQAKLDTRDGSRLSALTALNLSVAAGPVSPNIKVRGEVGAVDFNTTTAALPSAVLGSIPVAFDGATCTGASMNFRVASGATSQPVTMIGTVIPQACTITADALIAINARGASFAAPTYASANTGALGIGTIVPPFFAGTASIAAGAAAVAFGFTSVAGGVFSASQTDVGGGALGAAFSTTAVTVTPAANVGGNTAHVHVFWP